MIKDKGSDVKDHGDWSGKNARKYLPEPAECKRVRTVLLQSALKDFSPAAIFISAFQSPELCKNQRKSYLERPLS